MLEKIQRKEVDKRDKQLPQNFEQLIQMYNLDKIWTYIEKIIDFANNEVPEEISQAIDQISTKYITGQEIETNEYLDNKRIYKKYVSGTTPSSIARLDLVTGVDMIIEDCIYVFRQSQNQWHRLNYGAQSGDSGHISPVFLTDDNAIAFYIKNTNFFSAPYKGYIKYTKV